MKKENKLGKCPGCDAEIGPIALLSAWDKFGKFVCPNCGKTIRFRHWLLAVIALFVLFFGAERLLHWMLVTKFSLILSFAFSSVAALAIMMFVPRFWKFDKVQE